MQAIRTHYLGATNTKGVRVKATCEAGSVTVAYEYGEDHEGNHERAARTLIAQLGWYGEWVSDWSSGERWHICVKSAQEVLPRFYVAKDSDV